MRDRRIPDVGHLAAATTTSRDAGHAAGTLRKEICRTCNDTIYIDPSGAVVDSELIAVVLAGRSAKGRRGEQAKARRLHAETCERRARENAGPNNDQDAFNRRELARLAAEARNIRDASVAAQSGLRRIEAAASRAMTGKRGKRTRSM